MRTNEFGFIVLLMVADCLPQPCHCEEPPKGGDVAISRYTFTTMLALKIEVRAKMCHTLKRVEHSTIYQEIATSLRSSQ